MGSSSLKERNWELMNQSNAVMVTPIRVMEINAERDLGNFFFSIFLHTGKRRKAIKRPMTIGTKMLLAATKKKIPAAIRKTTHEVRTRFSLFMKLF
jgi:hypothetical protein